MKFLLSIALPLYALDQATKWWIIQNMPLDAPVRSDAWFQLCYWTNTGSAFGLFKNANTGFIVLSLLALAGLLVFYVRGAFVDALSRWGAALLVAGILGNLTDRLLHGHVVDFLLVDFDIRFFDPWPAFNVADSCICIAAALFVIGSLVGSSAPSAR